MDAIEEAKRRHPASGGWPNEGPYRQFFDALDGLSLNVALYGPSSLQADEARVNVDLYRQIAATVWRSTRRAA